MLLYLISSPLYKSFSKQVKLATTSNTLAAWPLQVTKQFYTQTTRSFTLQTHHISLQNPEISSCLTRCCSSSPLLRYLLYLEAPCTYNLCFSQVSANTIEGTTTKITFTPLSSNEYWQILNLGGCLLPEHSWAGLTRSSTGRGCPKWFFIHKCNKPSWDSVPKLATQTLQYLMLPQSPDLSIPCFYITF